MKKNLLLLIVFFIAPSIFSQKAEFITDFLQAEEADFGQVCYLSAVCQNLVKDSASETDAFNSIFEQGLIPTGKKPEDKINYMQAAYIFSKLWDIKGGLLFRMTRGNPRYAYKQFKNDRVIPLTADPSMIPSGTDILNMFTLCEKKYTTANKGE